MHPRLCVVLIADLTRILQFRKHLLVVFNIFITASARFYDNELLRHHFRCAFELGAASTISYNAVLQ